MQNIKDLISQELNFSRKYCARIAALHQSAKDEISALEKKIAEIDDRVPDTLNTGVTK